MSGQVFVCMDVNIDSEVVLVLIQKISKEVIIMMHISQCSIVAIVIFLKFKIIIYRWGMALPSHSL